MRQIIALTFGLIFITQLGYGQEKDNQPYIEVTGHAEKKIVPDEIYVSITIKERESGRDKISLEQQEKELKNALLSLNIPLDNLSVSDEQSDYVRVNWVKKDVVSQSKYELKLSTAQQVADVFEKLDELKIENAYISRVSHSKIKELKKEVEIEAIKAAKSKADYLLDAIGQETGSALIINERTSSGNNYYIDGIKINMARVRSLNEVKYVKSGQDISQGTIEFKKIKLETTIYVKFEIK